jgi:hypothetical protein
MEQDATADKRQCRHCKGILPYTPEHWPAAKGVAQGAVCRLCTRTRKRKYDRKYSDLRVAARTQGAASLTAATNPPASGKAVAKSSNARPGELPIRQLDVARALREGADRLNEAAAGVMATILEYAGNTQSPHHEWAIKLIAERVIPRKLFEDLGSQAAGIKEGRGTVRPAITVIVQQAAPSPPDSLSGSPPITIDVTPTTERSE